MGTNGDRQRSPPRPQSNSSSSVFSCCLRGEADDSVDHPVRNVLMTETQTQQPSRRPLDDNNLDDFEPIISSGSTLLGSPPSGKNQNKRHEKYSLTNKNKIPKNKGTTSKLPPDLPPTYMPEKKRERGFPSDPSTSGQPWSDTQGTSQKIKFLINVPMGIPHPDNNHPENKIKSRCQNLLTLLEDTGFTEEDKNEHLQDVAIIIGLNGKHSPEHKRLLTEMVESKEKTKLKFRKVGFTWGPDGDIKYTPQSKDDVPYQDIREELRKHKETKDLVAELRGNDTDSLIYFSFIDADTLDFNQVYSSYLEIVKKHEKSHSGNPPTLMSTGYEFPEGPYKHTSQVDREVRILTAEHFPLGTYYPEPNFCVLLPEGEETIPESFKQQGKGQKMESPKLVRKLKRREDFTAVFAKDNPIITTVPQRSTPTLISSQSHFSTFVWATSAYMHYELEYTGEKKQGWYQVVRGILIYLFNKTLSDDEFEDLVSPEKFPFKDADELVNAARAVRSYRRNVTEQEEQKKQRKRARNPEM